MMREREREREFARKREVRKTAHHGSRLVSEQALPSITASTTTERRPPFGSCDFPARVRLPSVNKKGREKEGGGGGGNERKTERNKHFNIFQNCFDCLPWQHYLHERCTTNLNPIASKPIRFS